MQGERFGRLVVIDQAGLNRFRYKLWRCKCDCGQEKVISGNPLRRGLTRSCGCLKREQTAARNFKHGLTRTPSWKTWVGLFKRCYDPNCKAFKNYGGRGIQVCARWFEFKGFFADMGERPAGRSIDRVNNDGHYMLSNCRWATPSEQRRNSRAHPPITDEIRARLSASQRRRLAEHPRQRTSTGQWE